MSSDRFNMSYVGIRSCGCIAAAIPDDPMRRRDIATALQLWILEGWIVERVTTSYVREHWPNECPHKARQLSPEEEQALYLPPSPTNS